jgi:hypothetical protein
MLDGEDGRTRRQALPRPEIICRRRKMTIRIGIVPINAIWRSGWSGLAERKRSFCKTENRPDQSDRDQHPTGRARPSEPGLNRAATGPPPEARRFGLRLHQALLPLSVFRGSGDRRDHLLASSWTIS